MKKVVTILQIVIGIIVVGLSTVSLITGFSVPGLVFLCGAILMLGQWYRTKLEVKEGKETLKNAKPFIIISLAAFAGCILAAILEIVSAIT